MPRIHPSLIVRIRIDERLYGEDVNLELKRNYNHVATTFVDPCETGEEEPSNTVRCCISLARSRWDANPDADALWRDDLPAWLRNAIFRISSTIVAQNQTSAEHGRPTLPFPWIELAFGDYALIALHTQADSSLPAEAADTVTKARGLLTDGTFGEDVACVRVPSLSSCQAQREALLAQEAEQETSVEQDESAKEQASASDDAPSAESSEDAEPETGAEAESAVPPYRGFAPDTRIWGIEYRDGSVREFDSEANAFIS